MKEKQKEIKNKLGEIRTEQEYYDWMQDWTEIRDKKVEEMAFKQGQSALSKTTFKPSINPRSEVLMKKKPNRVPVYEQEPNVKKGGVDKNCTFRPNLTKTLKKWFFLPIKNTTPFLYSFCWCWGSILGDEELLHDSSQSRALLSRGCDSLDESRPTLAIIFLPDLPNNQFLYFLFQF